MYVKYSFSYHILNWFDLCFNETIQNNSAKKSPEETKIASATSLSRLNFALSLFTFSVLTFNHGYQLACFKNVANNNTSFHNNYNINSIFNCIQWPLWSRKVCRDQEKMQRLQCRNFEKFQLVVHIFSRRSSWQQNLSLSQPIFLKAGVWTWCLLRNGILQLSQ